MPNPNPIGNPSDTLLSVSAVYLFGLPISDLLLVSPKNGAGAQDKQRPPRGGRNNFLRRQVRDDDAKFARIFFFSFEGGLFELARPALFLVHGVGRLVDNASGSEDPNSEEYRNAPPLLRTGLGWQVGSFARDMKVWVYDKSDVSMRLDADTGPLEQILLAAESGSGSPGLGNGVMARSSGAFTRSSNAFTRSSNAMRRSGDVD